MKKIKVPKYEKPKEEETRFTEKNTDIQEIMKEELFDTLINKQLPKGQIYDVLIKNAAIFMVNAGVGIESARKIFKLFYKGKVTSSQINCYIGWYNSAKKGKYGEFNKREINHWCTKFKFPLIYPDVKSLRQEREESEKEVEEKTNSISIILEETLKHERLTDGEVISYKQYKHASNKFGKGIFLDTFNKDPMKPQNSKYVTTFWIDKVDMYLNPYKEKEREFVINIKFKDDVVYEYVGNTDEIVEKIKLQSYGVLSKYWFDNSIRAIITAFVEQGKAKIKKSLLSTGFFEFDNKIEFNVRLDYPVELKFHNNTNNLKNGMKTLLEFSEKYKNKNHFLTTISWFLMSPFGFIRKQNRKMNKLLLLKGESQVGKGTLTRIGLSIWNINNPIYFKTGGTFKSEYRLGEFSDKTTFPFVADECKGLFDEVRFVEILKNLRTEITARERADKRFLGLSSFCGSMNGELPINIDDGLLNGLLLVNFTMDEKNTETEQDEFTNFYNKNNKKLGYIGGFLSNEITKNWKEYKPIILKFDQLEAGRELFKMLLEKAKIEKPEWIEEYGLSPDDFKK